MTTVLDSPETIQVAAHPGRSGKKWAAITGLVALTSLVLQLRVVASFGRHVVVEDQASIWYMGREWGRLSLHQPNYYGQSYGSNIEGIPVEMLRWLGVSPTTAFPLTVSLLMLGCWFALAIAAFSRGRFLLATAAAGGPLLLTTYYTLYSSFFATAGGRFMAAGAAALLIVGRERAWCLLTAAVLGGLALNLDTSSAILLVPAVIYTASGIRTVRHWAAFLSGMIPGVALALYVGAFYRAHPDYALHPSPSVTMKTAYLDHSLEHMSALWSMYGLELWTSWVPPVLVLALLLCVALAGRRPVAAVSAVAVAAMAVAAMSSERALDNFSPLLPSARIFLALPLAIWFVAFLLSESLSDRDLALMRTIRARTHRTGAVVPSLLLALLVASAGSHIAALPRQITLLVDRANRAYYQFPLVPTGTFHARCAYMDQLVRKTGIHLVVSIDDRTSAYGCGALAYGSYETLLPSYERRTWLLHQEAHSTRSAMIIWNVVPDWCSVATRLPSVRSCQELYRFGLPDAAVERFDPMPAVQLLKEEGVQVRPFGPGCEPEHPAHCSYS